MAGFVPSAVVAHTSADRSLCSAVEGIPLRRGRFGPTLLGRLPKKAKDAALNVIKRRSGTEQVVVVWLRVGDLRMHDNPALSAVAALMSSRRIRALPVATIIRNFEPKRVREAAADLERSLKKRGSGLIVRFVNDELEARLALDRVVRRVQGSIVFANRKISASSEVQHTYGGVPIRSFSPTSIHGPPLPAPAVLPRLPSLLPVSSPSFLFSADSCIGETAALKRLYDILHGPSGILREILMSLNHTMMIVSLMRLELRIGCISFARIRQEASGVWAKTRGFALASAGSAAVAAAAIKAYDVNGTDRRALRWDNDRQEFRLQEWEHKRKHRKMNLEQRAREFIRRRKDFLHHVFIPDDVTPDYYLFTFWRFSQRCMSATVGVFGTQALLLALGVKAGRIGQAAAISWVLKDGLGRVGKMLWAGSMGKDFDVDPKRWRFRSALLYAFGNGLEIVTQIFPASFLVVATAANSMKQVSMLTASATRNAMYRSFGGGAQNIANITAKGEAQIVVADLIGMATGIRLSKLIGTSRASVLTTYLALTAADLFGIYMELRAVVFRTLNSERSNLIVEEYIRSGRIPPPAEVSPKERIFRKPRLSSRNRFSSLQKAIDSPEQLTDLLKVFRKEKFLITCRDGTAGSRQCQIVLRKDATNADILRAIFVTGHVQHNNSFNKENGSLKSIYGTANKAFPQFYESLKKSEWNVDNMLFSTLKRRTIWGHGVR